MRDLKERGLLDETLVIWGGELGRTTMGEPRDLLGLDHPIDGYAMWVAGGGVKGGQTIGATDDPAPPRPRPQAAHVPLPGPGLSTDGREQ